MKDRYDEKVMKSMAKIRSARSGYKEFRDEEVDASDSSEFNEGEMSRKLMRESKIDKNPDFTRIPNPPKAFMQSRDTKRSS
jgi:hypothetical protein